ncbi:MAG: DUF975 family protein [Lachnospiraceae bacterium]|nr:DUF975 family protein [Lachnospiraceae bacterium]
MKDNNKKHIATKELKRAALKILKEHYALLVMICILAALLHTAFGDAFSDLQGLMDGSRRFEVTVTETEVPEESVDPEKPAEVTVNITGDPSVSTGMLGSRTAASVLTEVLAHGLAAGEQTSQEIQAQAELTEDPVFGRTRGYFSAIVNKFASGQIWITIVSALSQVSHSERASSVIAIILALFIHIFFWAFVQRFYEAVMCRIFLESHTYKRVPYTRFLYFHQVHRWVRTTKTLVLTYVYTALWGLTVIGGFIKSYSYRMVPYIIAENPDINSGDAIRLSRDMMNGHKWELFVKELSFIGWHFISMFTYGLVNLLFTNPYQTAFITEFYVKLRDEAKEKGILNAELLNDVWLYEKAEAASLAGVYAVEKAQLEAPEPAEPPRMGFFNFVADWFGVVLRQTPEEEAYEKAQATRARLQEAKNVLAGESYPMRLVVSPGRVKDPRAEGIYYMRNYSLTTICFLFLVLSFSGWIWEVSLHLIETGNFVNRGVLHGPWLPIYGTGSVIVILFLKKLRNNLPLHFVATIVLCGFVEYFTGLYLEMTHDGQKWWDYSGYFLNIQGRVCAEGLLAFGILGSVIIYLLAPALDTMTRQLPVKAFTIAVAVVMCVFLVDNTYSSKHPNMGEGITDIEPGGAETTNEGEESRTDQAIAGVIWPGGLT